MQSACLSGLARLVASVRTDKTGCLIVWYSMSARPTPASREATLLVHRMLRTAAPLTPDQRAKVMEFTMKLKADNPGITLPEAIEKAKKAFPDIDFSGKFNGPIRVNKEDAPTSSGVDVPELPTAKALGEWLAKEGTERVIANPVALAQLKSRVNAFYIQGLRDDLAKLSRQVKSDIKDPVAARLVMSAIVATIRAGVGAIATGSIPDPSMWGQRTAAVMEKLGMEKQAKDTGIASNLIAFIDNTESLEDMKLDIVERLMAAGVKGSAAADMFRPLVETAAGMFKSVDWPAAIREEAARDMADVTLKEIADGSWDFLKEGTTKQAAESEVDLGALGGFLLNWHGGQGDPIYAAGSTLSTGRVPPPDVLEGALRNIERLLNHPEGKGVWSEEDREELSMIADDLQMLISESEKTAALSEEIDFEALSELLFKWADNAQTPLFDAAVNLSDVAKSGDLDDISMAMMEDASHDARRLLHQPRANWSPSDREELETMYGQLITIVVTQRQELKELLKKKPSEVEASKGDIADGLKKDESDLTKLVRDIKTLESGGKVENLTLENAKKNQKSLEQAIKNKKELLNKTAAGPVPADEVEYEVEATVSDLPVRGNAMASDDEEFNKQVEDEIIDRLERGDEWAWCDVMVVAKWNGYEGKSSWLGGNSYKDKEDFVKNSGGYYSDLCDEALRDLENNVDEDIDSDSDDTQASVATLLQAKRTAALQKMRTKAAAALESKTCAECGEPWPCSDSKRRDIRSDLRARHHVADIKTSMACDACGGKVTDADQMLCEKCLAKNKEKKTAAVVVKTADFAAVKTADPEIVQDLQSAGVKPQDLQHLVEDLMAETAQEINSKGLPKQVAFLIDAVGEDEARKRLMPFMSHVNGSVRKNASDYAYTQNQKIHLPEVEITEDKPEYIYVPLRGHAHVLAVFDKNDECIGWVKSETLGSPSVKDWIKDNNWIDQGY